MDYSFVLKKIWPFLFLMTNAFATTTTSSLSAIARVTADCFLAATTLNFGTYDPILVNASSAVNNATTFQIACTKGTIVTISMDNGLYGGFASGTTRAMSDGQGHYLSYELYSDAGRGTIWNITSTVQFTTSSQSQQTKSVYGKIPGGQNIAAGNYTDTVTITASF